MMTKCFSIPAHSPHVPPLCSRLLVEVWLFHALASVFLHVAPADVLPAAG